MFIGDTNFSFDMRRYWRKASLKIFGSVPQDQRQPNVGGPALKIMNDFRETIYGKDRMAS